MQQLELFSYQPEDSDEEWKFIEGSNGRYMVSNHGRIKSVISNHKILIPAVSESKPWPQVNLTFQRGKAPKNCYVHKLVAEAFVPIPEWLKDSDIKLAVTHIDRDRMNNCADNLEWVSRTFLTEEEARAIKSEFEKPYYRGQNRELAIKYGVPVHIISTLKSGKSWGDL